MARDLAAANLTITFASVLLDEGEEGVARSIQIDLDEELNEGKTSFVFGDTAHFRVFTNPLNLNFICVCSDSSANLHKATPDITRECRITDDDNEQLTFINTDKSNLSFPCTGGLTATYWYGNDWGPLTLIGTSTVKAKRPSVTTPLNAQNAAAVCKVNYDSVYHPGSISVVEKPGILEWPVIVFIIEKKGV